MNILKSLVHVVALPIDMVADTVMLMADAADGEAMPRTRERFDKIADPDSDDKENRK